MIVRLLKPPLMRVAPLSVSEAGLALPLAQMSEGGITSDAWAAYVRAWPQDTSASPQRGWLSARSPRGAILGLSPWWLQPCPAGAALWSGPDWLVEPVARPLVAEALREAVMQLAARLHCARAYHASAGELRIMTP